MRFDCSRILYYFCLTVAALSEPACIAAKVLFAMFARRSRRCNCRWSRSPRSSRFRGGEVNLRCACCGRRVVNDSPAGAAGLRNSPSRCSCSPGGHGVVIKASSCASRVVRVCRRAQATSILDVLYCLRVRLSNRCSGECTLAYCQGGCAAPCGHLHDL